MDSITEAGIKKKSFELYYNGGSIWCEHLDGMGCFKEKVIEKFLDDCPKFSKPSMTSFMIINLDRTELDEEIISCIVKAITETDKCFMKIAFVGVEGFFNRRAFREIGKMKGCGVKFLDDYEKAKQWVLP